METDEKKDSSTSPPQEIDQNKDVIAETIEPKHNLTSSPHEGDVERSPHSMDETSKDKNKGAKDTVMCGTLTVHAEHIVMKTGFHLQFKKISLILPMKRSCRTQRHHFLRISYNI